MKKITAAVLSLFVPILPFCPSSDLHAGLQYNSNVRFSSEEHSLVQFSRSGTFVRIEDGSHWEVSDAYAKNVLQWRPGDLLIITPNPYYFSSYKYALRNLTSGTIALANLSIGPVINGEHPARQVSGINPEDGNILLSDGSAWFSGDTTSLTKWREKDYVIIGIANRSSKYRNILINVTLNQYIEAESY